MSTHVHSLNPHVIRSILEGHKAELAQIHADAGGEIATLPAALDRFVRSIIADEGAPAALLHHCCSGQSDPEALPIALHRAYRSLLDREPMLLWTSRFSDAVQIAHTPFGKIAVGAAPDAALPNGTRVVIPPAPAEPNSPIPQLAPLAGEVLIDGRPRPFLPSDTLLFGGFAAVREGSYAVTIGDGGKRHCFVPAASALEGAIARIADREILSDAWFSYFGSFLDEAEGVRRRLLQMLPQPGSPQESLAASEAVLEAAARSAQALTALSSAGNAFVRHREFHEGSLGIFVKSTQAHVNNVLVALNAISDPDLLSMETPQFKDIADAMHILSNLFRPGAYLAKTVAGNIEPLLSSYLHVELSPHAAKDEPVPKQGAVLRRMTDEILVHAGDRRRGHPARLAVAWQGNTLVFQDRDDDGDALAAFSGTHTGIGVLDELAGRLGEGAAVRYRAREGEPRAIDAIEIDVPMEDAAPESDFSPIDAAQAADVLHPWIAPPPARVPGR
jgi:hypothetical protein